MVQANFKLCSNIQKHPRKENESEGKSKNVIKLFYESSLVYMFTTFVRVRSNDELN